MRTFYEDFCPSCDPEALSFDSYWAEDAIDFFRATGLPTEVVCIRCEDAWEVEGYAGGPRSVEGQGHASACPKGQP